MAIQFGESNARLDGSGVWAAGADVKSVTTIRIRREHCSPAGGDPRASAKSLVRAWLEVVGDTRTHGAAHHPTRAGFLPSKRQTHYSSIRRCHISELLDATVRSCRPPPVAGESGLRGGERREHRDDVLQNCDANGSCDSCFLAARRGSGAIGRWGWWTSRCGCISITRTRFFEANSMANVERWAAGVSAPTYAIDDETAHSRPSRS